MSGGRQFDYGCRRGARRRRRPGRISRSTLAQPGEVTGERCARRCREARCPGRGRRGTWRWRSRDRRRSWVAELGSGPSGLYLGIVGNDRRVDDDRSGDAIVVQSSSGGRHESTHAVADQHRRILETARIDHRSPLRTNLRACTRLSVSAVAMTAEIQGGHGVSPGSLITTEVAVHVVDSEKPAIVYRMLSLFL